MDRALEELVWRRADGRCEYCRVPQSQNMDQQTWLKNPRLKQPQSVAILPSSIQNLGFFLSTRRMRVLRLFQTLATTRSKAHLALVPRSRCLTN